MLVLNAAHNEKMTGDGTRLVVAAIGLMEEGSCFVNDT